MNSAIQHEIKITEKNIEIISSKLSRTSDDSPIKTVLLTGIGRAHDRRFDLLGEIDDLHKAIMYWTSALTLTPGKDPGRADLLEALGTAHGQRFQRLGRMDDIEEAIKYACLALDLTPEGHRDLSQRLGNLSVSHRERFKRLGKLHDLEEAMKHEARALSLTPDDHPHLSARLANLGTSHSDRFQCLGELGDLEKAIQYQTRAVDLTPDGHPLLPNRLTNLGISYSHQFKHLGKLCDLEESIQYRTRAVDLTSDGHPDLSSRLANLGTSYTNRFERLNELGDLEKAIQFQSRALALTTGDHPDLSNILTNLGASHSCRFQRLGELGDLEKAIQFQSRALDTIPKNHPHLASILTNLGASHGYRFIRLGKMNDLEQAIQHESRALTLLNDSHPDLPIRLINLAVSHNNRFKRLGDLHDLEKAIQYGARAIDLTPDDHPVLSARLDHLGTSHGHRFHRLGELGDLKKAIQYQTRAVDLTPDGHPDLPARLANLGTSYCHKSQRSGEVDDFEKAIQYETRAVDTTPDGHPDFSTRLASLGASYIYRFLHHGDMDDLEQAIQYQSRALALTPDDHPALSSHLANHAASHRYRFESLGQLADLEKALQYQSRTLTLIPNGHPYLSRIHSDQAISYFDYYTHTSDPSYLQHSLDSFRMASQSTGSAPRDRFRYARLWAILASTYSALNPVEAYQATIDLLPQLIWLGATTDQRYEDLLTAKTLAVDAACAAILSLDYSLALEWLEHTRCVVWTQNRMLRSPLDRLQSSHSSLAVRLKAIATQLHSSSSESRESRALASGSMTAEQVAQEHRRLAQEYNELILKTRTLSGFEDFLQPIKASRLVRLARYGPIVVINCHWDRCDALLIVPKQPTVSHIPLPNFSGEKARHIRSRMGISLGSDRREGFGVERRPWVETRQDDDFGRLLAALWNDVVKPVLDFLGYTINVQTGSLPHITWCPTGAMSFLPLHAAGDYDQPQSRVFDYVVSSYTPTLTALLESKPSSLNCNSGLLAIGQPSTPGHSPLPGTVMELASVRARAQHKVRYLELMDRQATITAVLDAMEQYDWVHLACHAHQNVGSATESGFFLHDGTLDLAAINRRSFKSKGLAFLSACQTAKGDETLPDEAVHLASGVLMAGYTSVIATMWSVVDEDAPVVADQVYAQLMKDGKLGNGEAGRALHDAVGVLRGKVGEKEFARWVPYIHIGS